MEGEYEKAYDWAKSRQMRTCYSMASSRGAFYWTLALLEFKLKKVSRFDVRIYEVKIVQI